jgi:hypothetical protein
VICRVQLDPAARDTFVPVGFDRVIPLFYSFGLRAGYVCVAGEKITVYIFDSEQTGRPT